MAQIQSMLSPSPPPLALISLISAYRRREGTTEDPVKHPAPASGQAGNVMEWREEQT